MNARISVLGAGRMGSALAGAFLEREYPTDVWNRTRSKAEPLAARGARVAATVRDAVEAAEIVVVNVSDYPTSDGLLRSDDVTKGLRGKLLVQLTSGSPREAREMAAWARQHEIRYLVGAIMATPNFVGAPECTILYSGPSDLFEEYKPVLLALGGNPLYVGSDAGHASVLDTALLTFMWGALFGVLQGASVAQAEEFPLEAYMSALGAFTPVVDELAIDVVKRIREGNFVGDQVTVETCRTSVLHLIEVCKEHGIHRAVPDAFDQIFRAAVEAGHGQDDFAVLDKFMR